MNSKLVQLAFLYGLATASRLDESADEIMAKMKQLIETEPNTRKEKVNEPLSPRI